MAKTVFCVATLLALMSQGLTSRAHPNTTDCNAESCIFPEQNDHDYCSKALTFLDCIKDNIVDNRECELFQRSAGESVAFLAKYVLLLQDCQDVPGSNCDLKTCSPPSEQDEDVCQKVLDYQKCLRAEIFDNNECALFEKGAAASKMIIIDLKFAHCDEGEGHSWVEDEENEFYQALTVLLYHIQNETDTRRDPSEEKFEHFGAELCDVDPELVNKNEWKPFGPDWNKDVKVKPEPEEPQEDSDQVETEGILSTSEDTNNSGNEEGMRRDIEKFTSDSDRDGEATQEETKQLNIVSDRAGEDTQEEIKQFNRESDAEERQEFQQFKPKSYRHDEASHEDPKQLNQVSYKNAEEIQELNQFKPDSYRNGEVTQEDLKQPTTNYNKIGESIQQDIQSFSKDLIPTCDATRNDILSPTSHLNTANLYTIQKESEEKYPLEPNTSTDPRQALGKPLNFGFVKQNRRTKQKSTISKMA